MLVNILGIVYSQAFNTAFYNSKASSDVHIMKFYTILKRNKLLRQEKLGRKLKSILLSERRKRKPFINESTLSLKL